jgi:hypothetical protein
VRSVEIERGSRKFLSFAFFLKTETVRVRGEKRKEKVAFIECSNLERAKNTKKKTSFLRAYY